MFKYVKVETEDNYIFQTSLIQPSSRYDSWFFTSWHRPKKTYRSFYEANLELEKLSNLTQIPVLNWR